MYRNHGPLILASGSPRRQEFLKWMGLKYRVEVADIDESRWQNEEPEAFVLRLAREKGEAVAEGFPASWIVSGDTIVCLESQVLGKPQNSEEAVEVLMLLSGRTHTVLSAYSVLCKERGIGRSECFHTEVTFVDFSEKLARSYVATGEPLDKAGAYGIQYRGVALVKSISGSYSSVVGLPLAELMELLTTLGAVSVLD